VISYQAIFRKSADKQSGNAWRGVNISGARQRRRQSKLAWLSKYRNAMAYVAYSLGSACVKAWRHAAAAKRRKRSGKASRLAAEMAKKTASWREMCGGLTALADTNLLLTDVRYR